MFKIYDIFKKLTGILVYITYAILLCSALFITYSVFMRYVLKAPLLGSVEIIEVAMSAMVFASLAWTQTQKGHIHITMLLHILPKKLGTLLYSICSLLSTAVAGAAAYACFLQGQYAISISYVTAMTAIPYAPFYFFASFCMVIMTLVLLLDTIMAFAGLFSKEYEQRLHSEW